MPFATVDELLHHHAKRNPPPNTRRPMRITWDRPVWVATCPHCNRVESDYNPSTIHDKARAHPAMCG